MKEIRQVTTKRNLILAAVIVLFALFIFVIRYVQTNIGEEVVVEVDGEVMEQLSLNKNTKITIKSANNGENTLVIQDGYAYVEYSNCKNQICVHSKKINKSGESIVCLPHKVNIYILGGKGREMDAVTE